jgi:hypothetical protein
VYRPPGTRSRLAINEPWLIEENVRQAVHEVTPFLLRFFGRIFVRHIAPPFRKPEMAHLPDQLFVAFHNGQPRLSRLLLVANYKTDGPEGFGDQVEIQGTRTVAEADSIETVVTATTAILLLLAALGLASAGDPSIRNCVDWVSGLAGPLCLLPLLILWVRWSGVHQPSFQMFMARELIVLIFWVLAIIFSVRSFRKRPPK